MPSGGVKPSFLELTSDNRKEWQLVISFKEKAKQNKIYSVSFASLVIIITKIWYTKVCIS